MEYKALQGAFITLLRSELTEAEPQIAPQELDTDSVCALFALSKRHDLAHAVASALYKCGALTDAEMLLKFSREQALSVYRHEQIKYAYEQLADAFNGAGIPFIPLKGTVLREYYPSEHLRTSCDIDILVKTDDFDAAVDCLVGCGFKRGERNYHDVSLYSPSGILVELHFNIKELSQQLDPILEAAWDYASSADGSRYELSHDFFVFYSFAHMYYHFTEGGCGARPLMDIWVMQHKMGIDYEIAADLLKKAGIYKFAAELSRLSEICFSGEPADEFAELLLEFILSGGSYGSRQNKMAVAQAKTGGAAGYASRRLFLPLDKMRIAYPMLEKAPILLPFCWIARLAKALVLGKRKSVVMELKTAADVTVDEIERVNKLKERLEM